jgi:hypothetical protein
MQQTLDLALDLNCEFANFYSAMAYPGSPLHDEAVRNGWRLPNAWSGYSQHAVDTLPLPTRHVSAGEVLRFRDRAFDTYFRHEPYLRMVKRSSATPPWPTSSDDVAYAGEEAHGNENRRTEKRIVPRRRAASPFGLRFSFVVT